MAPKFGTSGLRGLVVDLTPALVADHVRAFIAACDTGSGICLGWDLRPSSPDIAAAVMAAARGEGVDVIDCGAVPTPALALAAQARGAAAIMITGSHIPADRNGLKFYSKTGEITKDDEAAIKANLGRSPAAKGDTEQGHMQKTRASGRILWRAMWRPAGQTPCAASASGFTAIPPWGGILWRRSWKNWAPCAGSGALSQLYPRGYRSG